MSIQNNNIFVGESIEFQFMCDLLAEDRVTEQEIRQKYEVETIDWKEFNRLIYHHRIYPLIYARLQSFHEVVPLDVMDQIQKAVTHNTFYMMRLTAEMERVTSVLEQQNIKVIMLKGPILAFELYGDLAHRTSKDLDLLVNISDVDASLNVLEKAGYIKKYDTPFIMEGWKWKDHHISLFHPEHKTQIEVHWKLNPSGAKDISFQELWNRRQTITIVEHEVSYLGKEDLFMYLVSHGARHGWFRLRWLMDIDLILRKNNTIHNFEYYAELHESEFYAGQAYLLCSRLLRAPLTSKMKELVEHAHTIKLTEYALNLILEEPDKETGINYLKQIKSPKRRMIMLLGRLYPGPMDAELLPLPRKLHFLYIPLRPFLWMWRRIRQRMVLKGRHEYD
ncbi:hypothetical protein TCA2_0516 [Paenibacillus sp. TCA20]|nr:hypothetical protein TCA2_0516 [Paenibacillus sp. TCA20]